MPLSYRQLSGLVSVTEPTQDSSAGLVDEVIATASHTERRNRSSPAQVMVYFAIATGLYSKGSYHDVLSQLSDGLAWASDWQEAFTPPSKSAIFQARARLEPKPLSTKATGLNLSINPTSPPSRFN